MSSPLERRQLERWQTGLRWALAVIYLVAGILHLRDTAVFVLIVPGWVPWPYDTVIATGVCELLGAVALTIGRLRKAAGIMLALYAVCVYPANIKHALDAIAIGGHRLGWSYHAPRLAFQPVLVWWALFCSRVTDWPFRRTRP
jgi:uncharacterized membrane protein